MGCPKKLKVPLSKVESGTSLKANESPCPHFYMRILLLRYFAFTLILLFCQHILEYFIFLLFLKELVVYLGEPFFHLVSKKLFFYEAYLRTAPNKNYGCTRERQRKQQGKCWSLKNLWEMLWKKFCFVIGRKFEAEVNTMRASYEIYLSLVLDIESKMSYRKRICKLLLPRLFSMAWNIWLFKKVNESCCNLEVIRKR